MDKYDHMNYRFIDVVGLCLSNMQLYFKYTVQIHNLTGLQLTYTSLLLVRRFYKNFKLIF